MTAPLILVLNWTWSQPTIWTDTVLAPSDTYVQVYLWKSRSTHIRSYNHRTSCHLLRLMYRVTKTVLISFLCNWHTILVAWNVGHLCQWHLSYQSASPIALKNILSFPLRFIMPCFSWNFHLFLVLLICWLEIKILLNFFLLDRTDAAPHKLLLHLDKDITSSNSLSHNFPSESDQTYCCHCRTQGYVGKVN